MKKYFCLFVVALMICSFCGCAQKNLNNNSSTGEVFKLDETTFGSNNDTSAISGQENISSDVSVESESSEHIHVFSEATCVKAPTCSDCGMTSGSALGHSFNEGKCSRCYADDLSTVPVLDLKQKAIGEAKIRLESGISYSCLIEYLEYEGFPHDIAVYAADNCGANWDNQALMIAGKYLNHGISYSGLVKRLKGEGFTSEQAEYAVDNCGANWNTQAVKRVATYLDTFIDNPDFILSTESLINELLKDGFTNEQAVYGVYANGFY